MSKKNRSKPFDELPATRDDWDFTGIPREELRLAEIYEYSREIKVVRDAFTKWLDSEAYIIACYEPEDYENGIRRLEEQIFLGCSYRDLITTLNTQGRHKEAIWSDIWDVIPTRLDGHRLSALLEMLSEWPSPYKIARKSESVKRGVGRILDSLSGRDPGKAVTIFDAHDTAEKKMGKKVFTVSVDCSKSRKLIEKEFGKICEPFLSSRRGRKNKYISPITRLKQLAAYRLRNRFIGKGKTFPSYARLVIEIEKIAQGNDPEKILPN